MYQPEFLRSPPSPTPPTATAPARNEPRALGPDLDLSSLARGLPLGDRIGPYTLRRWIGAGGMGAVFEAEGPAAPFRFAVKLVPPAQATPDAIDRLVGEGAALARLSHPGIVRCYDSGVHFERAAPVPYIAMELVPSAMDIVAFCELFSLKTPDIIEMMAAVCDAVQHAHERGVVHRDLKPSNILIDRLGKPRLIDFGVARSLGVEAQLCAVRTRFGQMVGTIAYMSPEQCEADPGRVDPRCDVYALGAILYQLLTGRPTYDFRKTPTPAAAAKLRRRPPTRPSRIDGSLKGGLEAIILRAIEGDPAKRYGSAAELAGDLRGYRRGASVQARPPTAKRGLFGVWERLARWTANGQSGVPRLVRAAANRGEGPEHAGSRHGLPLRGQAVAPRDLSFN